jgi:hypothetical protein
VAASRLSFSGKAFAIAILILCCAACAESPTVVSTRGFLNEGAEGSASAVFAMNGRPVRLELYVNIEGSGATIWVDHPDGRNIETIEVPGPGIRELCKEFPKEPGSWALRMAARGGGMEYWVALHDRKKYLGPDDEARRLVEKK